MIRPRASQGGGGGPAGSVGGSSGAGGRSGGPQRSAAASARSAGRAAAAAYAYRTSDATTLERLGLDYNELRALGDEFEVLRRIVDVACGSPDSTIEDHEQRRIAADVAEWVLEQGRDGNPPSPEEIVRQAIATLIAETLLVESGDQDDGGLGRPCGPVLQESRCGCAQRAALEGQPHFGELRSSGCSSARSTTHASPSAVVVSSTSGWCDFPEPGRFHSNACSSPPRTQ